MAMSFGGGKGETAAQKIGKFLEAKAKRERDAAKKAICPEEATASRYELMPVPFDFSTAHKASPTEPCNDADSPSSIARASIGRGGTNAAAGALLSPTTLTRPFHLYGRKWCFAPRSTSASGRCTRVTKTASSRPPPLPHAPPPLRARYRL